MALTEEQARAQLEQEAKNLAATGSATTPAPTAPNPTVPTNLNTDTSVVDFLTSQGQASDFNARTSLAQNLGIQNYQGTAEQNTELLRKLKEQEQFVNPSVVLPEASQTPSEAPESGLEPIEVQEEPQTTFEQSVRGILDEFGIAPPDPNRSSVGAFANTYRQLFNQLGLSDVKNEIESQTKAFQDLQDELSGKIADVRENPWLTEGVRQDRINALKERYVDKERNLLNRISLLQSTFESGQQEAQFITSQALGQERFEQGQRQDLILRAIDIAERQAVAERDFARQKELIEFQNELAGPRSDFELFEHLKETGQLDPNTDYFDFIRQESAARRAPSSGGFPTIPGLDIPTAPQQTFEEYLAEQEEAAGQTFTQERRDALRAQFNASQSSLGGSAAQQQWLSDPNVHPLVKQVISGEVSINSLTEKETKSVLPQLEQARAAGVIPLFTNDERTKQINAIQSDARQDAEFKVFPKVKDSYQTAQNAYLQGKQTGSGAADITLMRMIAKITDPDSAVREEEFKTFQGAQGTLASFGVRLTKQMWSGGQLTNFGREELFKVAQDIYSNKLNDYNQAYDFYLDQVTGVGGTASDFLPKVVAPEITISSGTSADDILSQYGVQ